MAQAAQTDGVALLDVAEFNALPGRGVQGQINGATYHLGNHRMLEELGLEYNGGPVPTPL